MAMAAVAVIFTPLTSTCGNIAPGSCPVLYTQQHSHTLLTECMAACTLTRWHADSVPDPVALSERFLPLLPLHHGIRCLRVSEARRTCCHRAYTWQGDAKRRAWECALLCCTAHLKSGGGGPFCGCAAA